MMSVIFSRKYLSNNFSNEKWMHAELNSVELVCPGFDMSLTVCGVRILATVYNASQTIFLSRRS